jgi:hypothetical protein
LKHCRELFSREAEKAHTLDRMKPLHKFLIGCIVCVVGGYLFHLMLQVGGHYNATIKPSGEDTQVFVFVEDSPKFQILFEKKSTAEAVKISPRKVACSIPSNSISSPIQFTSTRMARFARVNP